ncbi:MAG: hypothetical protein PHZ00_01115 [Candidatus Peribacteraceae bacterium]|nr:hypothetical protein [Candidatus Peribacteraceae bacterium]
MAISSFSLVLGVFCYVAGFPLIFCNEKHLEWRRKFFLDENMVRAAGAILAAVVVTVVRRQWLVTPDGEGVMVLLAWLLLFTGLFAAWWPDRFIALRSKWERILFDYRGAQITLGFVLIFLAAGFTYLGLILA